MSEEVPDEAFDKAESDFAVQMDKQAYSKLKKELSEALLFQTVASAVCSDKDFKLIWRVTNKIVTERRWRT